jgi:hypothetical protein
LRQRVIQLESQLKTAHAKVNQYPWITFDGN